MLIRANGARSGIKAYLEKGQMRDRYYDRDQLDNRLILAGDLNLVDDIINSYDNNGEKYFHYTLSFKEDSVDNETLQKISQEFREYYFKSFTDDELCYYAEAHLPKIKSYIDRSNGELVERKPHIHIVIPKVNMLTGGSLDHKESANIQYLDAFQEYINCKYGLESPKDNPRIGFNNKGEVISRYKGDIFKGAGKETKKDILDLIIEKNISSKEELVNELLKDRFEVKIRNKQDKLNSYLNVKLPDESKGINLKDYVFRDDFLKLNIDDKINFISHKKNFLSQKRSEQSVMINKINLLKFTYVNLGYPREIPEHYLNKMNEWLEIVSDQRKYADSAFSKEKRAEFKTLSYQEKINKLNELKITFYNKNGVLNYEPTRNELTELVDIYRTVANDNMQSARRNIEDISSYGEGSRTDQIRSLSRERLERVRDEYARVIDNNKRDNVKNFINCGGNERGTVLTGVSIDYINETVLKEEFKEETIHFRYVLKADVLLELLHKTHGVIADKYSITVAANGEDRIIAGDKYLSVVDFCRQEVHLEWNETFKVLRTAELMQKDLDRERGWTITDTKYLTSEYKSWLVDFKKAKDKELAELQKDVKVKFDAITKTYKGKAKALSENRELLYHKKDEQKRVLKMERLLENRSLYAARNKQLEEIKSKYNLDMQEAYRKFLLDKAESRDDLALHELKRLRVDYSEYISLGSAKCVDSYKDFRLDVKHIIDSAGVITYSQDGVNFLKDTGKRLDFLTRETDQLKLGLDLAISKFGTSIELQGSEDFRRQIVEVAIKNNYSIAFKDKFSEEYRKLLFQQFKNEAIELEKNNRAFFSQNFTQNNDLLVTNLEKVGYLDAKGYYKETNKFTIFDIHTRQEYIVSSSQLDFFTNNEKIKVGDMLSIDASLQNGIKINPYFWDKYTSDLKNGVLISDFISDDKLIVEFPAWRQANYKQEYFTLIESNIAEKLNKVGYQHGDLVSIVPEVNLENRCIDYSFKVLEDGEFKKKAKQDILEADIASAKHELNIIASKEITGKVVDFGTGTYKGKESAFVILEDNKRKISTEVVEFKENFCKRHNVSLSSLEKQTSGTVIGWGSDYYNDKSEEKNNYIKLKTPYGEKTIWGLDLERTIADNGIKVGDNIFLAKIGEKATTRIGKDGKEKVHNLYVYEAQVLPENVYKRFNELTNSPYTKYWNEEFKQLIVDGKIMHGENIYIGKTHESVEYKTENKNNFIVVPIDLQKIRDEETATRQIVRTRNNLSTEAKIYTGVFNNFGEHKFNNGKTTFYIELIDIQGARQRLWGDELKQLIVGKDLKIGDSIALAKVANNRYDCEKLEQLANTVSEIKKDIKVPEQITVNSTDKAQAIANVNNQPLTTRKIEINKEISYWDINVINQELVKILDSVLDHILPGKRTRVGTTYRYGSKGSLAVTYTGSKQGYWHDFETDEGGKTLVSLIQRELGYNYKEALDFAASLAGLRESDKVREIKVEHKTVEVTGFDDYQLTMVKAAQSIAAKGISAGETLVQDYLRSRGITAEIPDSIQFNPNVYIKKYGKSFPAMVVKVHNENGEVQSAHLTLLDSTDKGKAKVEKAKLKFGPIPEAINISLNAKEPTVNMSLIAEGLETALSIKSAFPECDVKAALDKGGFTRIAIDKLADKVVLCLDNDLKDWRNDKIINEAAKRLTEAGKTVLIAMPEAINNQKTDFNDILQIKGIADIAKTIQRAQDYKIVQLENTQFLKEQLANKHKAEGMTAEGLNYSRQHSGTVLDFGTKTIKGEKINFIKLAISEGKEFIYWDKNLPLDNIEKGKTIFVAQTGKESINKEIVREHFTARPVGKDLDKRVLELVKQREREADRKQAISAAKGIKL